MAQQVPGETVTIINVNRTNPMHMATTKLIASAFSIVAIFDNKRD